MIAANVLGVRVFVEYRGPQDGSSLIWCDGCTDTGKVSATTFLNVVQIYVKGQDTDSTGAIELVRNVVVVCLYRNKSESNIWWR